MPELVGRLIGPSAGDPAANMALDQTLLETVAKEGCPMLRWYTWIRPTLSLGYFQPLDERSQHRESEPLECVRRGTGGGAIVHHHELTYSVAVPASITHAGPRETLYRLVHEAFAQVLSDCGVRATPHRLSGRPSGIQPESFLCFQRRTPEDLIVAGYKVLGSAQRRARGAVLQHGSLLLRASSFAPQLPGILDLGATLPSENQDRVSASGSAHIEGEPVHQTDALIEGLASALSVRIADVLQLDRWQARAPDDAETARCREIERDRFANPRWLARR